MAGPKSFFLTPEIHEYVVAHGTRPDAVQQALIDETAALPMAGMQISPEQGAFMTLLTRLVGARQAVEVGTFTGYSALCIARGLSDDGHLLCCDVSEEWTSIARRAWDDAGVDGRIELRLAPAADTLRSLPDEEYVDLAFIDADKPALPRVLRGAAHAAPAQRAHPGRQHALGRQRHRRREATTSRPSRSARSTTWSRPTTGSTAPCSPSATASPCSASADPPPHKNEHPSVHPRIWRTTDGCSWRPRGQNFPVRP